MPTGHKTIVWTAANDERLLLSILAVHNIKIDGPSVARVFGNNIATSVIQTRMHKLRAKARALNPGVVPTDALVSAATKRSSSEIAKASSGGAKKQIKKELSPGQSDTNNDFIGTQADAGNDHAVTPPATPIKKSSATPTKSSKFSSTPSPITGKEDIDGQVQAKRCSPRDRAKPNYRQLDNPFVYTEEALREEGSIAMDQVTNSESEDSVTSDKDFDAEDVSKEA